MKKKILYFIGLIMTPSLILILTTIVCLLGLPTKIYTKSEEAVPSIAPIGNTIQKVDDSSDMYSIKFLGMIPLKNVEVQKVQDIELCPGGIPIGVRVNTKGVLVVGYSDVEINDQKEESPGKAGGLEIGDVILKINDVEMESSRDLLKTLQTASSADAKVEILRDNEVMTKNITLKKENDKDYKIGLWIRDSTAGVGTMTFYDPSSHKFGALGHPITDCDTNKPFIIKDGDLIESSIMSIRKGEKGAPGELHGMFVNENHPDGSITNNTQSGIFGEIQKDDFSQKLEEPMKVGFRNEIQPGKATIITTIDADGPQEYEIEIEKLLNQTTAGSKSMVIKITDSRLLEKTGGIVQGMSGSPIIQNGKIVGAVTHVLINKPDTGYGIYIEWMLQDAGLIK